MENENGEKSPMTKAKLIGAFAKAKLSMGKLIAGETATVKSDKANYSYRYADLASTLEVIDKPLASNGLVFVQYPTVLYSQSGAKVTVYGMLHHESGEWLEASPLEMVSGQVDPQKVGSAITYARRYQMQAFFGLAQEDDDGKSAEQSSKQQPQQRQPVSQPPAAQHRTPAAQPPTTNGNGNGHSLPKAPTEPPPDVDGVPESMFGGDVVPTDMERAAAAIIAENNLKAPPAAKGWAQRAGYCQNEFEAGNSWKKVVDQQFGGKVEIPNMPRIIQAYVMHQLAKQPVAEVT